MAAKLTASFILKLEDQLSGGLAKIEKQLSNLGLLGKKLGLGSLEAGNRLLDQGAAAAHKMADGVAAIGRSADRAGSAMHRMAQKAGSAIKSASERIGVIGAAVAGLSVMEPIRAYSEQENSLRHIAITEKKSGPGVEAEIARLNTNLNREALLTGQNSKELAKAYNFLITTGMSPGEVDKLMPAHAKAATAYNISSESMGQAVFALADTMKIGHAGMPAALASMAYAAKEGHFSVEDFSHFLPTVSASMSKLGMTGRGAADTTFAALETVRKSTGDAGTAATDFKDFLDYVVSPFGARSFAKAGVNLPEMLRKAEKQGVNPLDAVLGKLAQMTKGKSPVETAQILGTVLHNQQARDAALALLKNQGIFQDLRKKFGLIDDKTIGTDFDSAFRAPVVQLRIFNEQVEQLNRRIGDGFAPVLVLLNKALKGFRDGLAWMDEHMPGVADKIMLAVAGLLLLVAAAGALGVALPPIMAGFEMIGAVLTPEVAIVALFAAAVYDIIDNWQAFRPFFVQMFQGLRTEFFGFIDFLKGVFTGDTHTAIQGLKEIFAGWWGIFRGEFLIVEQLFTDFSKWVDDWSGGAWSASIDAVLAPFKAAENFIVHSALGRLMGLSSGPVVSAQGWGHEDGDGTLQPISQANQAYVEIGLAPELTLHGPAQQSIGGLKLHFVPADTGGLGKTLSRP